MFIINLLVTYPQFLEVALEHDTENLIVLRSFDIRLSISYFSNFCGSFMFMRV